MPDGIIKPFLVSAVPLATAGLVLGLRLGVVGCLLGELLSLGSIQATFEFAGEFGGNLVLKVEEFVLSFCESTS